MCLTVSKTILSIDEYLYGYERLFGDSFADPSFVIDGELVDPIEEDVDLVDLIERADAHDPLLKYTTANRRRLYGDLVRTLRLAHCWRLDENTRATFAMEASAMIDELRERALNAGFHPNKSVDSDEGTDQSREDQDSDSDSASTSSGIGSFAGSMD